MYHLASLLVYRDIPHETCSLLQKLAINLNILADDSHTPVKLLIKAGTSLYDLQDVKTVTMDKPTGWITFEVGAKQS